MSNIIEFPYDRVKGRRVCTTCEIYIFPAHDANPFNPFTWWRMAVRWS